MSRILKYLTVGLIIFIFGIWIYLNRERGNPVENFNYFHNTFNEKYALFEIKKGIGDKGIGDGAAQFDNLC